MGIGLERYAEGERDNKEKVLLIEDVSFLRMFISKRLAKAGFNTIQAADAREAVQLFREEDDIKAVVLDFELPDQNGDEVYRQCRDMKRYTQNGEIPCPPFILMSAHVDFEKVEEVMNGEFHTIFRKPLVDSQLIDALDEIMQRKKKKPKLLNLALNPKALNQ